MNSIRAHNKRILALMGMGMALLLLVACSSQTPPPSGNAEASGNQPSPTLAPISNSVSNGNGVTNAQQNGVNTMPSVVLNDNSGYINGISVSGMGQAHGTPDLATINLGVEASRDTVQAARDDAAAAMDQVITVLREQGIQDRDIQTSYFSIHPRYDREGLDITSYQVSNQLSVKVRDLGRVSAIIDEVTAAGGNLTRFQGVSFSIEDTKALEEQARAAAVEDLAAKANQLASLMGVGLGSPVSIVESGGLQPIRVPAAERAFFDQAAGAPTPIMPGEVDVTVTIQAVYAIQPATAEAPTP